VRFADEWCAFLPAGAMEPMRGALGLSYAQASAVLVALPAGGIVGGFFVAAADHVSRRVLASAGALVYGLALIVFGTGHSLPVLLAAAFCWGAASDAFVHGAEVALVDLAGDELPRALARINGWAAVGDLLGPATLAAAAALGFGWRGAFLGCGAGMLGYAAWLAASKLPPPGRADAPAEPFDLRRMLAGVAEVAKDRRVIGLALLMGLFSLLDEPLAGFLIAYLERVRGLTPALASAPVVGILVGGMAGYALFERLAGARPARTVAAVSAAVMAASLPAAIFAPWLAAAVAAGAVFGAAGALFYTALGAATLSLRPGQAGTTSAVVGVVDMAGIGFPAVVGMVADAHGLAAGMALYAAVPLVTLALVGLWRRG
jgi:predicted MFS family arabinose efflux permease